MSDPSEPDLDGCEVEFDNPEWNTGDDQVAALVLYADVDFTDPDAVAQRQAEWEGLFGGS